MIILSTIAESLLPLSQPTKGWDFRNWEGPVRSPRWKHFKCEVNGGIGHMLCVFLLFSWHKLIFFFPFADRSSQIPGSGAAVPTWPDRRRKLGHPRGSSLRHPEVRHGPSPHTLLDHCIMWGIDSYQRSVAVHLFKGFFLDMRAFFPSSVGILSLVSICSIYPLSVRFWGKTTNRSQEAGTQRREDQGRLS